MKKVAAWLIVAPFALSLIFGYLILKSLDWAIATLTGNERVVGGLREELRSALR